MSVDLSKVIFASSYDAFKNDSLLYTGSISFPTSLTAGQISTTIVSVPLGEVPQFSKFFANFQEYLDATVGNPAQWYPASVGGNQSVGIFVNSPAPNVGWITASVYPVIATNEIFVTAQVFNPYGATVTLNALTVPFAFVEYTLAN